MFRRLGVLVGLVCVFGLLFGGVAFGSVSGVWWGLGSGARPSSLLGVSGVGEVQDVTVTGSSGEFVLVDEVTGQSASFVFDASRSVVQGGLEGLFGVGNVRVTGGPGDPFGSNPYVVRFIGDLSDQPVKLLGSSSGGLGGTPKGVSVEEVSQGANDGQIIVTAQNLGTSAIGESSGLVSVEDSLPPGLRAVSIEGVAGEAVKGGGRNRGPVSCVLATLKCTYLGGNTVERELRPDEQIEVRIGVIVEAEVGEGGVSLGSNVVRVFGGGGALRTLSRPVTVGESVPFGLEDYELVPEEIGGGFQTSAGSHPFQVTTTVTLNQNKDGDPVALPRDLHFMLPEGFVGNPTPFVQCTDEQFSKPVKIEGVELPNECPASSAIGVATITINEPSLISEHVQTPLNAIDTLRNPVFNLTPLAGEPARFGFRVGGIAPAFLDVSIGPESDYRVVVSSNLISEIPGFLSAKVTLWGVPGEPVHDSERGWSCIYDLKTCSPLGATETPPFLLMPSSCEQPFSTTATGDSWKGLLAESVQMTPLTYTLPTGSLVGCNQLPFEPSIEASPDVPWGNTPTGLGVRVHVPQQASLNPKGLAEAAVRNTTVGLPEGLMVSPGGADGLESCSETEIGLEPGSSGENLSFSGGAGSFCPDASKIGTVELETPLLPNKLEGSAYLASQDANPFGSLIAIYLVIRDPVSGTLIKLAGEVHLEDDGRLISTFKNTPQLPFENLRLKFFGEPRAPLSTPPLCGEYETAASFVSWSSPTPKISTSRFQLNKGPHGGSCVDPNAFAPELQAGSLNIQAGAYTPFTTTMTRPDWSQPLGRLSMLLPPGLSGVLSNVTLCQEPQANEGLCPPSSLIGHTVVSAGLGDHPVTVKYPGNVYITGPYDGAPFGLSIANPAAAGPFDLGTGRCDCIVVRAKIEVDPTTAQLTVTSDPLPTILQGVPLQIQHVNVTIDKNNFTFNPTNCNPMNITGTITSSTGTPAHVTTPLQVTNCTRLAFKPRFKASTTAKTSRKNGASLTVKLTYPKAPWGSQANIRSVKVDLPKQLPSRLTTLQKACLANIFNQNPASCPTASRVGTATATTPLIPVPLNGPAYFVSNGGAKFPELIIVLQGYGITVNLHGETFINKKGITSSTFKQVPDVPVNTFQLTLPQGPNSALAANGNLCTTKLNMPTSFTAQNNTTQHTTTKITTTHCPKTQHKKKQKKKTKKKKH